MKIIYAFYRNRNGHSNEDFCKKSSLQAMFMHESRYMLRLFSKASLSEDLCLKVYKNWAGCKDF